MSYSTATRFDIAGLSDLTNAGVQEDQAGMLLSVSKINRLVTDEVDAEENPISSTRVIVGGFSQGGAMALLTGLTSERKLAGVACLSGWLPLHGKIKSVSTV